MKGPGSDQGLPIVMSVQASGCAADTLGRTILQGSLYLYGMTRTT